MIAGPVEGGQRELPAAAGSQLRVHVLPAHSHGGASAAVHRLLRIQVSAAISLLLPLNNSMYIVIGCCINARMRRKSTSLRTCIFPHGFYLQRGFKPDQQNLFQE